MTGRVLCRAMCVGGIAMLAISLPTRPAAAEPIGTVTITSGSVTVFLTGSDLDLTGTEGFSLHGSWDSFSLLCLACQPGETQDFSATLGGSLDGTGTFRGQTYDFNLNVGGASLNFDAAVLTLPTPPPGDTAQFTLPFSLHTSGSFRSFVFFDPGNGTPGFQVPVRGSGSATFFATVIHDPVVGPLYLGRSLTYQFAAPTPEPASLVLVGSGILVGFGRRMGRSREPAP